MARNEIFSQLLGAEAPTRARCITRLCLAHYGFLPHKHLKQKQMLLLLRVALLAGQCPGDLGSPCSSECPGQTISSLGLFALREPGEEAQEDLQGPSLP